MLQDISAGRLENEYRNAEVTADSRVLCFRGQEVLLGWDGDGKTVLPRLRDVEKAAKDWDAWEPENWRYAFRMLGEDYFLFMGTAGEGSEFAFAPVRRFREISDACFAVMTGWHLYQWYRSNRFCGCCGERTVHDDKERMVRCPSCGQMIFPRISPAVIIAVTDGERLLLSKYAGRGYRNYALIAGYTEIGETLEQTVHREVMEEVGLKVKNIRYYKSQPWGVDSNVLAGFFCDLDGDDTIRLDERELALAQWHYRDALPVEDDGVTLTRAMIGAFCRGEEPKE